MSDSRLAGADFVRAAACLMVVTHHLMQRLSREILGPNAPLSFGLQMFAFGVAGFFVLSGYLLARPFWLALDKSEPMPSLRTYALRRGARILPAFWLNLTIVFIVSVTLLNVPLDGTLILRYAAGMFLVADFHWLTWFPVEFNGPLWSISAEITCYALLPLCLWLLFKLPFARGWWARLAWALIIGALVGLQMLALRLFMPDPVNRGWEYGLVGGAKFWWPNYNPIAFFAIFAIGALAAGLQVQLARFRSGWFDLVSLGGLGLAIWSLWVSYPTPDAYGLAGIPYAYPWFPAGVALFLIGTPSSIAIRRLTELAPIAYVARISFGIYIWHYFIMELIRMLWERRFYSWGMVNIGAWAWISLAVVVMSFFIATLSYALLEEPIIRWARRLERRPTPASPTLSPAAG